MVVQFIPIQQIYENFEVIKFSYYAKKQESQQIIYNLNAYTKQSFENSADFGKMIIAVDPGTKVSGITVGVEKYLEDTNTMIPLYSFICTRDVQGDVELFYSDLEDFLLAVIKKFGIEYGLVEDQYTGFNSNASRKVSEMKRFISNTIYKGVGVKANDKVKPNVWLKNLRDMTIENCGELIYTNHLGHELKEQESLMLQLLQQSIWQNYPDLARKVCLSLGMKFKDFTDSIGILFNHRNYIQRKILVDEASNITVKKVKITKNMKKAKGKINYDIFLDANIENIPSLIDYVNMNSAKVNLNGTKEIILADTSEVDLDWLELAKICKSIGNGSPVFIVTPVKIGLMPFLIYINKFEKLTKSSILTIVIE